MACKIERAGVVMGLAAWSMSGCAKETVNLVDDLDAFATSAGAAADTGEGEEGLPLSDSSDSSDAPPDDGRVQLCGNNVIDGDDVCDGPDLADQTCTGFGFEKGDLACSANCAGLVFDGCGWFECGNGEPEGDEDCDGTVGNATCLDVGFDNGTLFCTTQCEYNDAMCGTCGDEILDPGEDCEAAFALGESCQGLDYDSGDLACGRDCQFDVSGCQLCGNDLAEGTEACDGAQLRGASCAGLGLGGGELACSETCTFDLANCDIEGVPFGDDGYYTALSLQAGVSVCDDISATGASLNLFDDSDATVGIGFTFQFYGVDYTQITVSSNGTMNFGAASVPGLTNQCLPFVGFGGGSVLMPFWDDLNPSASLNADVRYETLGAPGGQRLIVEWNTPFYGTADSTNHIVVRVALREGSNAIDVCYIDTAGAAGDLGNLGAAATSGIQLDSTTGIQFSCNTASLVDGLQLMYLPQ